MCATHTFCLYEHSCSLMARDTNRFVLQSVQYCCLMHSSYGPVPCLRTSASILFLRSCDVSCLTHSFRGPVQGLWLFHSVLFSPVRCSVLASTRVTHFPFHCSYFISGHLCTATVPTGRACLHIHTLHLPYTFDSLVVTCRH